MCASLVNDLVFIRYRRLQAIVIVEITKSQCLSIYKIQNTKWSGFSLAYNRLLTNLLLICLYEVVKSALNGWLQRKQWVLFSRDPQRPQL